MSDKFDSKKVIMTIGMKKTLRDEIDIINGLAFEVKSAADKVHRLAGSLRKVGIYDIASKMEVEADNLYELHNSLTILYAKKRLKLNSEYYKTRKMRKGE